MCDVFFCICLSLLIFHNIETWKTWLNNKKTNISSHIVLSKCWHFLKCYCIGKATEINEKLLAIVSSLIRLLHPSFCFIPYLVLFFFYSPFKKWLSNLVIQSNFFFLSFSVLYLVFLSCIVFIFFPIPEWSGFAIFGSPFTIQLPYFNMFLVPFSLAFSAIFLRPSLSWGFLVCWG